MGCLVLRMPGKREESFRAERPPRRRPCALKGRFQLFFPFPGSPSPSRNSRRGGMGQLGRKCLKSSSCQKNPECPYGLCCLRTVSYLPRPPISGEGRGAERERGLLGSFPPRFAYFAMSALNKNSREAERYLSIMGSATGSSLCIPCGISGVTAAMA